MMPTDRERFLSLVTKLAAENAGRPPGPGRELMKLMLQAAEQKYQQDPPGPEMLALLLESMEECLARMKEKAAAELN